MQCTRQKQMHNYVFIHCSTSFRVLHENVQSVMLRNNLEFASLKFLYITSTVQDSSCMGKSLHSHPPFKPVGVWYGHNIYSTQMNKPKEFLYMNLVSAIATTTINRGSTI